MFEDRTFENIMDEMLEHVDPLMDIRQGSVIYDALAPIAMELEQVYADLGLMGEECFADTASYYYLIKRAAERGIFVREGTPAVLKVQVAPAEIALLPGTEFNVGEKNYTITEDLTEGFFSMTCTETGVVGKDMEEDVIPLEEVEGLESIEIVSILDMGSEDEDEESLRDRYFASFEEAAFGGNRAEYREKADDFAIVGSCKVIPAWNGGGTVKLVLLGADYGAAGASVVDRVQEIFDPVGDGSGMGLAPIGHIVTVVPADEEMVDVFCRVTLQSGYVWEDVRDSVTASLEEYFLSLRKTWEDTKNIVIRRGQIESILLNLSGVDDVAEILLNGTAGNITIEEYSIPKVGEVSGQTGD